MHQQNEICLDKNKKIAFTKLIQAKSKNINFQEFQKVYGPVLNKDRKFESKRIKNDPRKMFLSSSSEVKMIRMEMPKLGSEHAILSVYPSRQLIKKHDSGYMTRIKKTPIKTLIEEAKDTTSKLKQIRKILQEQQSLQITYSTLTLMQKKLQQVEHKYLADPEIETIFQNTFIKQKDSLQEIPEEDIEKMKTEESAISAHPFITTRNENKLENIKIDKKMFSNNLDKTQQEKKQRVDSSLFLLKNSSEKKLDVKSRLALLPKCKKQCTKNEKENNENINKPKSNVENKNKNDIQKFVQEQSQLNNILNYTPQIVKKSQSAGPQQRKRSDQILLPKKEQMQQYLKSKPKKKDATKLIESKYPERCKKEISKSRKKQAKEILTTSQTSKLGPRTRSVPKFTKESLIVNQNLKYSEVHTPLGRKFRNYNLNKFK